ncbi:MAG: permease-like cell division protein FtsX [Chromatiales bacterium]|nr:permease-like cell division protein FtsX [Chromatiales bacterium]
MARQSKRNRKASGHLKGSRFNLAIWITRHLQVALASLGRLSRVPFSTLMTAAVIGIALALPAGLHLLVDNLQTLSGTWNGAASISLFLKQNTDKTDTEQLINQLQNRPGISEVTLITREQALGEFKQLSGFTDALQALQENPLPDVIVVVPDENYSEPGAAEQLVADIGSSKEVDYAQLDLQWVKRFHGITEIAKRGVFVLASLLGLAVLLIVGNTIRLEIQNRHSEIEITKLIGATNAFIRRPFLYSGFWYGLLGGFIAWGMIVTSLLLLAAPVGRLAGLYNSDFQLSGLGFFTTLTLLLTSALLGLLGSWLAVGRHLNKIEPS